MSDKPFMTIDEAMDVLEVVSRLESQRGYANACREIIRLNELLMAWKLKCGSQELEKKRLTDEIARLNEVIDGMKVPSEREQWLEENYYSDAVRCDKCKSLLQQVRPGKWQCPECE